MVDVREAADSQYRLTVLLGTTAEGKELWMSRAPGKPLRKIAFKGGGQLPECLEGGFSTIQVAKTAVEAYIEAKAKPAVKKGRSSK